MDLASIVEVLTPELKLSEALEVTTIDGGAINTVYRFVDAHQQFAVKWINSDAFSGINRFHQFVLQEQLANRGLAPKPVWLSDDGNLWVEKWYASPPDRNKYLEQKIPVLAQVLVRIHEQPITARPLALPNRFRHYINAAELSSVNPLVHEAYKVIEQYHLAFEDDQDLCLCHNDLALAHILCPETPVVVDWEYAAMGNRFFDLASCAVINELSDDESRQLCQHYSHSSGLEISRVNQGFSNQQEVVKITNALWQAALDKSLQAHPHAQA